MKNLKEILEIVAYQINDKGNWDLVIRKNGYHYVWDDIQSFGVRNALDDVLELEDWVRIHKWCAMMDNEHEEKYVPGTNVLKGSPEAMELQHQQDMEDMYDDEYEPQEQYEMRMDAHCTDQELQNAAEDRAILGDLSALHQLKVNMTGELPNTCPQCGNTLRHKMSGRICDNYPCNYSVSL